MQAITHTQLERLIRSLPEGQLHRAYRLLLGLLNPEKQLASLQMDVMQLSLEERRRILSSQAEQLKKDYDLDEEERMAWQSGAFVDDYGAR